MVIEFERFCSPVDSDFICSICQHVVDVDNTVRLNRCDHMFCRSCIDQWLASSKSSVDRSILGTCPVDRSQVKTGDLVAPNRTVVKLIRQLQVKCLFENLGCEEVTSLGDLKNHENSCDFNPGKKYPCVYNCKAMLTKEENESHVCIPMKEEEIEVMKKEMERQDEVIKENETAILELEGEIAGVEAENNRHKETIEELRNEIDSQNLVIRGLIEKYSTAIQESNHKVIKLEAEKANQEKMNESLQVMVEDQKNLFENLVEKYTTGIQELVDKNAKIDFVNKGQEAMIEELELEVKKQKKIVAKYSTAMQEIVTLKFGFRNYVDQINCVDLDNLLSK